jgi:hypothetical protein
VADVRSARVPLLGISTPYPSHRSRIRPSSWRMSFRPKTDADPSGLDAAPRAKTLKLMQVPFVLPTSCLRTTGRITDSAEVS